jgi:ATP-dependent HslUV protease subunit HslV
MTTIVLVRKNNEVVVAGDGQVSMGNTVGEKHCFEN